MDDNKVEGLLNRLGNRIPVDHELKNKLRQGFEDRKPKGLRLKKGFFAAACIGLVILITGLSVWFTPDRNVEAEAFKVQNYRTYIEVESNYDLSVAEYNGILFVPDINEGIFMFDGKERQKIYDGKVSLVRISPDGKKLAFFENGKIGILDLANMESSTVLESSNSTAYEGPTWMDNNTLLFTRQEFINAPGSNQGLSGIYKLDLTNHEQNKLADGTNGSYAKNGNNLVYQKGDKIASLNLTTKQEIIIDEGMQPAISPDGSSIAYTKLDITYVNIKDNVKIERILQNIWVADGQNFGRKTEITSNIVLENINEDEWLKNLKPSNELQMLSLGGRYCYLFPTWNKTSNSIYALRRDYSNRKSVVVKIDLGRDALSPEEVVERFLQSAKLGDEDYQSSLSNIALGKIADYNVLKRGQDGSKIYYDAEIKGEASNGETLNTSRLRLYIEKRNDRFIITEIKRI